MRKFLALIIISVSLVGCKSGFKSNFRDFNAYYNTFYNAKKSYKVGLEKSLAQSRQYNTLQPLRVYQPPLGAGASEFQNAIEKGASVLRKYKETKWVDNSLEIIGKSYYYKKEYFSAIQKFEELYISSADIRLKQSSILWKGRVLMELQAYNEGIQYLEEQLSVFSGEWQGDLEYQVKVVLAEHYIARENWVNALDLLTESVAKLPSRATKERGFFVIGQINEILGDPKAAFSAYDRVGKYYTEYELQFEAKKKKAEVARSIGNTNEAYKVFSGMVRDDKNTEFIAELNYELGRTEQERGNYENARDIYQSILSDPYNKPQPLTNAQVYNGLAELYRFNFNDFKLAAAYYDSSAKINVPAEQLPESYNATTLAQSFGEYASLKNQIHEEDSLLWLGTLPEAEFDSVIAKVEERMIEQMKREMEAAEERRNTMVNVGRGNGNNETDVARNGFLNVKNSAMVADAREQFRAVWPGRYLVDNWRVSVLMQNEVQIDNENGVPGMEGQEMEAQQFVVEIDLSRIPFTPQDQDSVLEDISFLRYELGNLFFLSLDLPDSAAIYFNRVLNERPQSKVAVVAMYSLSELYDIEGNQEQAIILAEQLVEKYPSTIYADRVVEKYGLDRQIFEEDEVQTPLQNYLTIQSNSNLPLALKADTLAKLAVANPNERFSNRAMYESIRSYIDVASQKIGFNDSLDIWYGVHEAWEQSRINLTELQDSIRVVFVDSSATITGADSLYFELVLDSTLTKPDFNQYFPYYGAYWDSTRARVNDFTRLYSSSEFTPVVKRWQLEFKKPVIKEPVIDSVSVDGVEVELEESPYLACEAIEQTPLIRGGIELFNQALNIPEGTEDERISFLFFINSRGIIDEFKLSSETKNERLINAYINAIDSFISFEPIMVDGVAQMVSCEIDFKIPK